MTIDNVPCCLLCGDRMTVTKTTDMQAGLVHFERQHLACLSCGDLDSRLVFVPANSVPAAAGLPADGTPADEAGRPLECSPLSESAAAPVCEDKVGRPPETPASAEEVRLIAVMAAAEDAPPFFAGWPQVNSPRKNVDSQVDDLAATNQRAQTSPRLGDLLQNYLSKWRHHHNTT